MATESKILLQVEGMDCANCAQTISRSLQKNGLENVNVNFASGEVTFELVSPESIDKAVEKIHDLGYHVTQRSDKSKAGSVTEPHAHNTHSKSNSTKIKFYWSALFSLPLLMHMFLAYPLLHNAYFQLILCTPVMLIGWSHFGKSAWSSLKAGFPNMDVLITIGSSAAFIYSLIGMFQFQGSHEIHNYLFFETAATIITLVLLGNLIEQRSVRQTTTAIHDLSKLQPNRAKLVVTENGNERIIDTDIHEVKKGDILLVNTGDKIPVDGIVLKGDALINESIISGESLPVSKEQDDQLTGGTLLESGSIYMKAERVGADTTLSQIIQLVKDAQHSKPEIQKLGDRISAIFVPAVIAISTLTFIVGYFFIDIPAQKALMSAIAVLVVSCPCAMGLATPTAVMVGLGRAAHHGILIKGGSTLEQFTGLKTIVFDKTGTLTTGRFKISQFKVLEGDENEIKKILHSLEQHSSHPIAQSLTEELKDYADDSNQLRWKEVKEDKGIGINAEDDKGNLYSAGSYKMVRHFHTDNSHAIYILKNNKLIATVDLSDEIKKGTKETIAKLKAQGLRVIMLSGDRDEVCQRVARETGITEVFSEQLPAQKLALIQKLSKESPTAMIGDGINDAPALAKATIGISLSNATAVAMQSAQVILLQQQDLSILIQALSIGRKTYQTIRQNLFWAFFYNVLTIPIAAAGLLSPMIGALSMAFSDLVVIGNSVRLKFRKIDR
ncbi:MAG: cation-translocating P-type ATPase [Bacteroidetes bacterium]|nr:MAG: cation-translocating P-type ATPase [Bacteroidota bacterium]